MRQPCDNCPFRPRTFTPLQPDCVSAMLDEVTTTSAFFMYCHKDLLYQNVECVGARMFRDGVQSSHVFKNDEALVRAHERSKRASIFHWHRSDCECDTCK